MRKWLFASLLALAGLAFDANRASAWWYSQPAPASVSFPLLTPSGYYTNTYSFAWYYPWYANYNYSHGSYANWYRWHGWAFYSGQQIPPNFRIDPVRGAYFVEPAKKNALHPPKKDGPKKDAPKKEPGKVTIALPADAKLTFNGVSATGTGGSRTYVTGDLDDGRDYEYMLAAEVTRDGQTLTATQRVIVRAGSVTQVSLVPAASASK